MTDSDPRPRPSESRPRMAGGIFIFLGLLIGAVLGVVYNEPSIGMIAGFAIGTAIAVAIWLLDRRRT